MCVLFGLFVVFAFWNCQGKVKGVHVFKTGKSECESSSATCEFCCYSLFFLYSYIIWPKDGVGYLVIAYSYSQSIFLYLSKILELWFELHQIILNTTSLCSGITNTPKAIHFISWRFGTWVILSLSNTTVIFISGDFNIHFIIPIYQSLICWTLFSNGFVFYPVLATFIYGHGPPFFTSKYNNLSIDSLMHHIFSLTPPIFLSYFL